MSEVGGYLLARGLIGPEAVLDGHLTIVDLSSRNQNCAVSMDGGGLFLKQAVPGFNVPDGAGAAGGSSLAHEAAVYELIGSLPRVDSRYAIGRLMPQCHGYDEAHGLLVLELIGDARDLTSHHTRTGRYSKTLARWLGAALANLHETAFIPARQQSEHFRGRLPWVLGLDSPGLALWREASNAGLQLVQILQASAEMRHVLACMRENWVADAFVHHDIKWDNCLVQRSRGTRLHARLALVDWEFADLGDACWDAGSVLGNYLSYWLASVPVTGTEPPDRYLELARHPLVSMQPAMQSFWAAYEEARSWDVDTARSALIRSVRYAGARLLQSAYERTVRMTHLDGNSVCLVQLALNVMTRPHVAAHSLLGIDPTGGRGD